jgi:protein deglycase
MARVITILAEGFEETEAVTFIDLLRRAGIEVILLGLTSSKVKGSHAIIVEADGLLEHFTGPFDGIVLPGGQPGTNTLAESAIVLDYIQKAHAKGLLCAAICAAPLVLGKAGILNGVRATCFPGVENRLTGTVIEKKPVVRDGNIITSRGVGTAIVFALEIITYFNGTGAAEKIASSIVYNP